MKVKAAVGMILILMSMVHVIYGEKMQVAELKKLNASNLLIGSFRVMSLQGGVLLFAVGIVELLTFFQFLTLTGFAMYIPVGIVCLNVLSVFMIAFTKHPELIKATIPQFIIILIIISLQLLSVI